MIFHKKTTITLFVCFLIIISTISAETRKVPDKPYIPDISTFLEIGSSGSPGFGKHLGQFYFTSGKMSGANQLYRINEEGWPYQLTFFEDGIDGYVLSHEGSQAVVLASRGGSEQSQLYLLDAETGRIEQLTDNPEVQYGSITWDNNDEGYYYRSNIENGRDFKLYYHSLSDGSDKIVFDMEGANYIADLSYDGRFMTIIHLYSNANDDLYLLDLESGEYDLLTPHEGDVFYDYPTLTADNKTLYLTCNDNKLGISKRARLDVKSKKIEYLDPESNWIVEDMGFSYDRRYMYWLVNEDGYSSGYLWDMKNDCPLDSPPVKGLIESPRILDDGRLMFVFNSPSRTQDIWIWDWRVPELKKLTHAVYAGIDRNIFVEPILIKYKSFDGLEIPAFLYLPPDFDGQPIPFIFHIHGGPESQFRPAFQRHFQYLTLNGYGILAPNIRGSTGYGREYQSLDDYKNRLNSIKDIKAGAEFLIKKGYTKKGMIGIKGASYGGYAVLAAVTEYPDLFSAAVDEVGIANFVSFLNNTSAYRRHIREAEYGPLTDEEFLKSVSPIHKAAQIKTPLLVIHGENDPRVPVDEARQIISAIQNNGGVVDSMIFADEGHGIGKRKNIMPLYRKMVKFFDEFLKKE